MPYDVVKRGSQFCVEKKDGSKTFGCHPTRDAANKQLAALYANEPKVAMRFNALQSAQYEHRIETIDDREHVVVPVVALVPGVVHAMNASCYERVYEDEYLKSLAAWDGQPIMYGHPTLNKQPISAHLPHVRRTAIGFVRNPTADNGKMQMEACIDRIACEDRAPELLERALTGEPIEVSVGVMTLTDEEAGELDGVEYRGAWRGIVPNHLAMLPLEIEGACSNKMGCGVRAAQEGRVKLLFRDAAEAAVYAEPRDARSISQAERDKIPDEDFAGPNRTYFIQQPEDVDSAAHLVGKAASPDSVKSKIISIAYRKGKAFVAQLPDSWKKKADQKAASAKPKVLKFKDKGIAKLCAGLRVAESNDPEDEDAEDVGYQAIVDALGDVPDSISRAKEICSELLSDNGVGDNEKLEYARLLVINATISQMISSLYGVQSLVSPMMYKAKTDACDDDNDIQKVMVVNQAAMEDVQERHASVMKDFGISPKAAQGSPCGCGGHAATAAHEGGSMKKEERVAALLKNAQCPIKDQKTLDALSDDALTTLEKHLEFDGKLRAAAKKEDLEKAVGDYAAAHAAVVAHGNEVNDKNAAKNGKDDGDDGKDSKNMQQGQGRVLSTEEFMKSAPKEIRDLVDRQQKQDATRREKLVKSLKDAQKAYSEKELTAMPLDQLEKIAEIALDEEERDFSGRGLTAAAAGEGSDYISNPPNGYELAIKKMREAR